MDLLLVRRLRPFHSNAGKRLVKAGAEIDLVLEIPGHGLWALEIKRGLSAKPEKGYYSACEDLKPQRRYLVHSGAGSYPIAPGLDAIGVVEMAAILAGL